VGLSDVTKPGQPPANAASAASAVGPHHTYRHETPVPWSG
jgi:hypothetical protein